MTTLDFLSSDVLGSILDLLYGSDLIHIVFCGSTRLNAKIFASLRHFTHIYSSRSRPTWPKLLSRFSALESLSLWVCYPHVCQPLAHVDILSLSPTLRHLDLNFCNAFLSLLELPPEGYTADQYMPSVRSDIRERFNHLRTLKSNWKMTPEMRKWDFTRVAKELCEWTEIPLMPLSHYGIYDIEAICNLPDGTKSLTVTFPDQSTRDWKTSFHLPSGLDTLLIMSPESIAPRNVFELLPTNLRSLEVMSLATDKKPHSLSVPLPPLAYLSIEQNTCDSVFIRFLPKTLTRLVVRAHTTELESFAVLPPSLTSCGLIWQKLTSSTTGCTIDAGQLVSPSGLSDEFLPSMRESVVLKLPRGLQHLLWINLRLFRPKDWDALPRGLQWTLYDTLITITPDQVKFASSLPIHVAALAVRQLTPEDLQQLPRNLTSLNLDIALHNLPSNLRTKDYMRRMLRELVRFRNLRSLTLRICESFDARLLFDIGAPLENLCLDVMETQETAAYTSPTEQEGEWTLPKHNLARLRKLVFSRQCLRMLHSHWSLILPACLNLEILNCKDVGMEIEPPLFPAGLVRDLPKLTSLVVPLDCIDVSLFPLLPARLTNLDVHNSPEGGYELQDMRLLPKTLAYVHLPAPESDMDSRLATELLDSMIPSIFELGTTIKAGYPQDSMDELYRNTSNTDRRDVPQESSLVDLVQRERQARQKRLSLE